MYLEVDFKPLRNCFVKVWIGRDKDVLVIPETFSQWLFALMLQEVIRSKPDILRDGGRGPV